MRFAALGLALLATAAFAAPAGAATVSVGGTTVTISAPDRERNGITVTGRSSGGLTIRDARTPLTAGAGCTQTRPDRATCGDASVTDLAADLGPLGDGISVGNSAPVRATLRGGSGNDTLRGGQRNDLLVGGTGRDTVTYSGRRGDVTVTLGGGADDGLAGEGDEVVEVERAVGGNGFDTLIGDDFGNGLSGGPGDDRLDGAGGVDTLTGGRGQDLLQGGDWSDRADYSRRTGDLVVDPDGFADDGERPGPTLTFEGALPTFRLLASPERDNVLPDVESVRGGAGADVIAPSNSGGTAEGGPGTDVVFGGPGTDSLSGDAGFDRIVARDLRTDAVRCGTDVDRVWMSLSDTVDVDCEQRLTSVSPRVVAVARTLDGEGLRVRVECPPQAFVRCGGTLRATTVRRVDDGRRARLALGSYGLVSGASEDVVLPFDAEARAIVSRFAPIRVRVALRGRDDAGPARPSATRLVLRG